MKALADRVPHGDALAALRRFVELIARSHYAGGLHPVLSMWTIRLYQMHEYDPARDPYIAVSYDAKASEFVIEYLAGPYQVPNSTSVVKSHWTKRDPDGFSALERCLEHLQWFN